jgi:hypothetical protein
LVKSWLRQEDVDLRELEAESDLECTGPVSGEIDYEADMGSTYGADIDSDEEPGLDVSEPWPNNKSASMLTKY